VVVADGERDCVGSRWLEAQSTAHQVLREGMLGVCAKMEASAAIATSNSPGTASPSARRSRGVVACTIVGRRHRRRYVEHWSRRSEFVCRLNVRGLEIMVLIRS
jgi:hypothetical protein